MTYAHANTHREYTNMRYAVQHALMQAQYACAKCMRTTATWHSPKIKVMMSPQGDFPPYHVLAWKRLLKLLRSQAHLETNIRDRWQNHSQPAKGPGVRCIRYQGVCQSESQELCAETDWEKLCLLLLIFADLEPLTYLVTLMVLHGQFHS